MMAKNLNERKVKFIEFTIEGIPARFNKREFL
jgi:hypothetical protein